MSVCYFPELNDRLKSSSCCAAAERDSENTDNFRDFKKNLLHDSLKRILSTLKPGMTTAEVVRCADGHLRRALYALGPYIADYPEQVLLACVVYGWCPM